MLLLGGVIRCKRSDESWLSALDDFRRANGAGVVRVWLAGSMGLLPLTRVLLCTALNRRKTVRAMIFIAAMASMLAIDFKTMFA
ncbi:hypothetical protein [Methylophilus luteus]|uniref:Uncharacterized protein n=1 Tax=Methylophilus luteus TaxID=640108 RepID=A0ABW3F8I6_9PROT